MYEHDVGNGQYQHSRQDSHRGVGTRGAQKKKLETVLKVVRSDWRCIQSMACHCHEVASHSWCHWARLTHPSRVVFNSSIEGCSALCEKPKRSTRARIISRCRTLE